MNRIAKTHARARRHEERKGWSRAYPDTPMLDADFKLGREAKRALRAFRRARPFRLSPEGWLEAARALLAALAEAHGMPVPTLDHEGSWEGGSDSSCYTPWEHRITMRGAPSVLTLLHEYTHARGYGEVGAVWWSVNAFKSVWPKAHARLVNMPGTHVLRRGEAEA
jgi:hypothetical protein